MAREHHDLAYLHYPTKETIQESTSQTLQFLRYGPDKILKVKVTTTRLLLTYSLYLISVTNINFLHLTVSKRYLREDFKIQDRTMTLHTQTSHHVPSKFQLPTPYSFGNIS